MRCWQSNVVIHRSFYLVIFSCTGQFVFALPTHILRVWGLVHRNDRPPFWKHSALESLLLCRQQEWLLDHCFVINHLVINHEMIRRYGETFVCLKQRFRQPTLGYTWTFTLIQDSSQYGGVSANSISHDALCRASPRTLTGLGQAVNPAQKQAQQKLA